MVANRGVVRRPQVFEAAGGREVGPADAGDLLRAAGGGDETAFASLYDLLSPRVCAVIRRVVRDRAQADEVTQEVLIEVWRTAARFDAAKGTPVGWIYTIAHRRAIDRARSEQAATARTMKAGIAALATNDDPVADKVIDRLEHQQVRHCLAVLTPVQHQAVTLAFYHGYTYREVADLLEIPLPTAKSRIRDGLLQLRDCLEASSSDLSQPAMGPPR